MDFGNFPKVLGLILSFCGLRNFANSPADFPLRVQ